jgi:hypothetical protein
MPRRKPQPHPGAEIEFIELPPRPQTYDWVEIAERLKANPLQWARIFTGGRVSIANAVRQGSVNAVHPDLGFEVQTRNNVRENPRTCDLYLRFNPDRVKPLRSAITKGRMKEEK